MKRALVTHAEGDEFQRLLEIARPSLAAFADVHGFEFVEASVSSGRPPSWDKVPALRQALLDGYEEALWVDCDIVVVDDLEDMDVPVSAWQALVRHRTADGDVPNCAVWLVRQPMIPWLDEVWKQTHRLNHGWWEQAALLDLMGWQHDRRPAKQEQSTALAENTFWLDHGWNVHLWDTPGAEHPRFMHATMHSDREAVMREWAAGRVPEPLAACGHRYPVRGCVCVQAAVPALVPCT